mgnify:CR=1 FL=1
MKLLMILAIFLLLGAFFIITNENINLKNPNEINNFAKLYYSWFIKLGGNAKTLTSYVAKLEWMP